MTVPDLVDVHLLDLPVPLAGRFDEHFEGLLREFALIAGSGEADHHVPVRLLTLVDTALAAFDGLNDEAAQRVDRAVAAGEQRLADHVVQLPPAAAPVAQALADLLEEADDYCRQGQHLLTVPAQPDVVAFRRWYAEQLQTQLRGEAPVPWPQSPQARALRPLHDTGTGTGA
jgi:hypothetical protein